MKLRWLAFIFGGCLGSGAADTHSLLDSWLGAQARLKSWSADFTQTRTLKTLRQPLTSAGRLTFAAPNSFRWELGTPAQTIAIRHGDEMTVIYPRLKRAERYPLSGAGHEPWRDALALMDAGFASSRAELEERFNVLSLSMTNGLAAIALEPRSPGARRFMARVEIFFRTNDFAMSANQLQFADGSTLRNDFTGAAANAETATNAFAVEIPGDFAIVEPMKK